jgi:hypothetical protein
MQNGQVEWDAVTIGYHIDLTTKFTVLYLIASTLVFLVRAVSFVPMLRRLRVSAALLREPILTPSDAESQQMRAANPTVQRFRIARAAIQRALLELRRWMQLTALILLAYSATEIASELRRISIYKMTEISSLSGSLGQIFSVWEVALWFVVVLGVANWILSERLARCADLRTESLR